MGTTPVTSPLAVNLGPAERTGEKEEMTTHSDRRATKRTDEHAAMLEEALARPGVREVMEVYGGWRRADQALEAYRAASKETWIITTSDRTNPLPKTMEIRGVLSTKRSTPASSPIIRAGKMVARMADVFELR